MNILLLNILFKVLRNKTELLLNVPYQLNIVLHLQVLEINDLLKVSGQEPPTNVQSFNAVG